MENKEMSQEKIESPDEKLIQHSESKKAMNGFQGSIVCAIILGLIASAGIIFRYSGTSSTCGLTRKVRYWLYVVRATTQHLRIPKH